MHLLKINNIISPVITKHPHQQPSSLTRNTINRIKPKTTNTVGKISVPHILIKKSPTTIRPPTHSINVPMV